MGKLNLKGSRIYRISAPGQKLNKMRYFAQIKSPTRYGTLEYGSVMLFCKINVKECFCLLDLKFLNLSASHSHLSHCHWFEGRGLKSGRLKAASLGRIYKLSDGWKELNVSLWLPNLNISLQAEIKGRGAKQNAFSKY